jgi:hypothetical protein
MHAHLLHFVSFYNYMQELVQTVLWQSAIAFWRDALHSTV